jgi:alpha-D-ribose 1-methylphosphonate 5-triphosphate synthase subunit PhnH
MMMSDTTAVGLTEVWTPLLQQQLFRNLMTAFSFPGRCICLPEGVRPDEAITALTATLVDAEVSLADVGGLITALDLKRIGAAPAAPETAHFITLHGDQLPDFMPCIGSLESPEGGATCIIRVNALATDAGNGCRLSLQGAGIDIRTDLVVDGLDAGWVDARAGWNRSFPMGVDLILCDGERMAALPRTTRINIEGAN